MKLLDKEAIYAARANEKNIVCNSSTGGIFTILSDYILDNNGAIACAIYDYQKNGTYFEIVTDKKRRDEALGSKYMQSIPGNIFSECKNWIKSNPNKKLLFIGMGCQAEGFRSYAENNNFLNSVYIVDIICHGVPSPLVWKDYVNLIEEKNKGIISYLSFKDKRNGWNTPYAFVKINNKEVSISEYVKMFYSGCILRPSCHYCPYTTIKRKTDLTIGDFWGIEKVKPDFYSREGNALIIIHSQKGNDFFNAISSRVNYVQSNDSECLQPNLIEPTTASKIRNEFWKDYHTKGVNYVIKKYFSNSIFSKVKKKIKHIVKSHS